ncbi:conserved hypothetical protein [Thermoplasma acidophilum]|uniref:SpoVT-AbrB domain-containing protein n=1 Tax=Thermoplasma acidophilum (strain ATCC 25905 / DSM 1728 / JCM 9062 / NBRC 15155 / AMRC-C165) TaxID=273075 RepID=Q9HKX7_THEAC|nr:phosphate uptake regulator PhoU [Thermoplasma acidophilum]CAC11608.1 conserved hypothetical protein [Thermoplasma acidophilum]
MSTNLRRIQKIKGGSYIVSLPSDWVRDNGLDVTREVEVFESSGIIKIRPKKDFNSERVIEYTDEETAEYLISVYYMQGMTKISLQSKDVISRDVKDRIKMLQLQLPGLNLKEETFNSLVFEVDEEILKVQDSFFDFSNKALSILKDVTKVIETPREDMKQDLTSRCLALNSDYYKLIRSIALTVQRDDKYKLDVPIKDIILYAVASRDLGRFITHTRLLIGNIKQEDMKPRDEVLLLINTMENIISMFKTEDINMAPRIRRNAHEILQNLKSSSESNKELERMTGYALALMDDAVHKAVHI